MREVINMSVTSPVNKQHVKTQRFNLVMIVLNSILVIFHFVMITADSGISWIGFILNGLSLIIFIDLFKKEKVKSNQYVK